MVLCPLWVGGNDHDGQPYAGGSVDVDVVANVTWDGLHVCGQGAREVQAVAGEARLDQPLAGVALWGHGRASDPDVAADTTATLHEVSASLMLGHDCTDSSLEGGAHGSHWILR